MILFAVCNYLISLGLFTLSCHCVTNLRVQSCIKLSTKEAAECYQKQQREPSSIKGQPGRTGRGRWRVGVRPLGEQMLGHVTKDSRVTQG